MDIHVYAVLLCLFLCISSYSYTLALIQKYIYILVSHKLYSSY